MYPEPWSLSTLTERMPQFGHIPAIPTLLLVAAAAMPAQCVPCPKPSFALLPTKLYSPTTFGARSGWELSMPVSTTAMTMFRSPRVVSQAEGADTACGPHCAIVPYLNVAYDVL